MFSQETGGETYCSIAILHPGQTKHQHCKDSPDPNDLWTYQYCNSSTDWQKHFAGSILQCHSLRLKAVLECPTWLISADSLKAVAVFLGERESACIRSSWVPRRVHISSPSPRGSVMIILPYLLPCQCYHRYAGITPLACWPRQHNNNNEAYGAITLPTEKSELDKRMYVKIKSNMQKDLSWWWSSLITTWPQPISKTSDETPCCDAGT